MIEFGLGVVIGFAGCYVWLVRGLKNTIADMESAQSRVKSVVDAAKKL